MQESTTTIKTAFVSSTEEPSWGPAPAPGSSEALSPPHTFPEPPGMLLSAHVSPKL